MPGPILGKRATASIHAAVTDLFDRARARLLGRDHGPKRLEFGAPIIDHREDLSIPGVFDAASKSEGFRPNDKLRGSAVEAVKAYLDAYEARAKHQAVSTVQAAIHDVAHGKLKSGDVHHRLQADLSTVMATATADVKRMAATEVVGARNLGVLDGLVKANTLAGVSDPVVYWVSVNDSLRCLAVGERVVLSNGRTRAVQDLVVGDRLAGSTRPSQKGGPLVTAVQRRRDEVVLLEFDNGRSLKCNPSHPILVKSPRGRYHFIEVRHLRGDHDVVFVEDVTGKGDRQKISHANKPRPFMKRLGYPDTYTFWKDHIDLIAALLREGAGRREVMKKYGMTLDDWEGGVGDFLKCVFPGIVLKGGRSNNLFNAAWLSSRQKEYESRWAVLGDAWLQERIRAGDTYAQLAKRERISAQILRKAGRRLGLESVTKARGPRVNWSRNRDLLLRKAIARGAPHLRGRTSRPEARVRDLLAAAGVPIAHSYKISNMKVDFAIVDEKVVIEYDGSGHTMRDKLMKKHGSGRTSAQIDYSRDVCLRGLGFRVLRIVDPKDRTPAEIVSAVQEFRKSDKEFSVWRA